MFAITECMNTQFYQVPPNDAWPGAHAFGALNFQEAIHHGVIGDMGFKYKTHFP